MTFPISLTEFQSARARISPWVKNSALDYSRTFSELVGVQVYLKMENEQRTGSFKIRGALNKVLSLSVEERKKGLISCSAGNHAQGVAYAAQCVEASSLLVLPENTPVVKEEAVRHYGAQIILHGKVYDESYSHALNLSRESKRVFIHAYQDPMVIAGQGSIALEIWEQLSDLDSVIIPIGGGGLISGMASVIKQLKPGCRVYGVVSSLAPAMEYLFHEKNYVSSKDFFVGGLADGIAVKSPSHEMFETYISKYVDDIVSVTDDEIAAAMVLLLERSKTLAEGAGAASVAALLKQNGKWKLGKKCALIVSGGNIDLNILSQVVERGLKSAGRLAKLSVITQDRPGSLNEITHLLSQMKTNILSVHHERNDPQLSHGLAEIQILMETRGKEHLKEVHSALKKQVYKVREE